MISRRLWILLLVSVGLSAWVGSKPDKSQVADWVAPPPQASGMSPPSMAMPAASPVQDPWLRTIKVGGTGTTAVNPPAPVSNSVITPPMASVVTPVVAAPPPVPTPPPVALQFLGKVIEEKGTVLYLLYRDESYAVQVGDTIENVYRIESISEDRVKLKYLPMNAVQELSLGS